MGAGMAASLLLSGVMGFTTLQAVEARNDAQTARGEAEGLVEYMIKDLKFKLEPVGRLDLLEGIGDKAVEYYDRQDIKSLNDDSLNRQAAARQVLAQVHLDAGRMNEAQAEIEAAADLTREVFERNPDDTDAIFAHAQSEYWVGQYYRRQGKLAEMEKPWREYDRLAQVLYETDPTNFDWVMEAAWGQNNLGLLSRQHGTKKAAAEALDYYTQAIELFEIADKLKPNTKVVLKEIENAMSGKSYMMLALHDASSSRAYKIAHIEFLKSLIEKFPADRVLKLQLCREHLNFYTDFVLVSNKDQDRAFSDNLDELIKVIKYDNDNQINKHFFLNAVFDNYQRLDEDAIQLRYSQVKGIIKDNLNEGQLATERNELFLKTLATKIDLFEGNTLSKKNKLNNLLHSYKGRDGFFSDDWKAAYALFSISKLSLKDQDIAYFSEQFLKAIKERSDIDYPKIVLKKLEAYSALGDCKDAIFNLQILEHRGYSLANKNNLSDCL